MLLKTREDCFLIYKETCERTSLVTMGRGSFFVLQSIIKLLSKFGRLLIHFENIVDQMFDLFVYLTLCAAFQWADEALLIYNVSTLVRVHATFVYERS